MTWLAHLSVVCKDFDDIADCLAESLSFLNHLLGSISVLFGVRVARSVIAQAEGISICLSVCVGYMRLIYASHAVIESLHLEGNIAIFRREGTFRRVLYSF